MNRPALQPNFLPGIKKIRSDKAEERPGEFLGGIMNLLKEYQVNGYKGIKYQTSGGYCDCPLCGQCGEAGEGPDHYCIQCGYCPNEADEANTLRRTRGLLWTPQHDPTPEQLSELEIAEFLVVRLRDEDLELFDKLANCPGNIEDLHNLAKDFYDLICHFSAAVLPIGSPAFNFKLHGFYYRDLISEARQGKRLPKLLFAHSERNSLEEKQPDGSVKKTSVFRHKGFI